MSGEWRDLWSVLLRKLLARSPETRGQGLGHVVDLLVRCRAVLRQEPGRGGLAHTMLASAVGSHGTTWHAAAGHWRESCHLVAHSQLEGALSFFSWRGLRFVSLTSLWPDAFVSPFSLYFFLLFSLSPTAVHENAAVGGAAWRRAPRSGHRAAHTGSALATRLSWVTFRSDALVHVLLMANFPSPFHSLQPRALQ